MIFSKNILIEEEDFMENAPPEYHRLSTGKEVRLRGAYIIRCEKVIKNEKGKVIELRCTYDPTTKSGSGSTKKVKGTIHWVSEPHSRLAEIRLYDRLFKTQFPGAGGEEPFKDLNENSLIVLNSARVEASLGEAQSEDRFQFERQGYFCVDRKDSQKGRLVFNRTVTLKDSWIKEQK